MKARRSQNREGCSISETLGREGVERIKIRVEPDSMCFSKE